jgi:hypothetical protein
MPTLADLVASRTRAPSATVRMGGQLCRAVLSLRTSQAFGSGIATGTIVLRNPPVTPAIGTTVSWSWGFNGVEVPGFTGEIARPARKSYPNRYTIECRDVLWRADRSQQVIATEPLNSITASAAIRYILTHYGGISNSRISLPTFTASGSEWGGSEWTLGILTPVSWGDTETNSGGTTALKAAQDICSVLGYWLYADASGIIRAKQMERAPSLSPVHTFMRGVDLLTDGSPELVEDVDAIKNRIIVQGRKHGRRRRADHGYVPDEHPVLPAGVYQEDTFSSFLIEYVNASQAGAASATEIAKRILKVRSRLPIVVRHRTKADPRLAVGATVAILDTGIGYTTAKNFFIYALETSLDCVTGAFDQQHTLDGGTGNSGYTTIPPPDASFSWRLVAETLAGDAVVEVFLDGSGSTSLSGGEIVSWDWSTSTTTYSASPNSATGVKATLLFLASEGTADITLTVTDTTSKTGSITQTIDLTGADTMPPIQTGFECGLRRGVVCHPRWWRDVEHRNNQRRCDSGRHDRRGRRRSGGGHGRNLRHPCHARQWGRGGLARELRPSRHVVNQPCVSNRRAHQQHMGERSQSGARVVCDRHGGVPLHGWRSDENGHARCARNRELDYGRSQRG